MAALSRRPALVVTRPWAVSEPGQRGPRRSPPPSQSWQRHRWRGRGAQTPQISGPRNGAGARAGRAWPLQFFAGVPTPACPSGLPGYRPYQLLAGKCLSGGGDPLTDPTPGLLNVPTAAWLLSAQDSRSCPHSSGFQRLAPAWSLTCGAPSVSPTASLAPAPSSSPQATNRPQPPALPPLPWGCSLAGPWKQDSCQG